MSKYYKVLEDNFMWNKGGIICDEKVEGEFRSKDPIFDRTEDQTEYISKGIIEDENNKDFFTRVYPVNLITKTVYKVKEQAKEMLAKEFN